MLKKFNYIFSLLFLFSFGYPAQQVHIKIIETTDTHGALFPYDFTEQKPLNHSLAQIYTYVKKQRKNPEQNVLLFSNGDILQGTPVVYYYNFERQNERHVYAEAMNYMGYDAATVGNHDIEAGHDVYDKFRNEITFPWLAANAVNKNTGKPYFQPYFVKEINGVKIAALGLITPAIPNWLPEILWEGIKFDDMVEAARKWTKIIKEKENPDILIGLFHAGTDLNYGGANKLYLNENASEAVAKLVPGFDLIFVGHDHHGWNYKVANEQTGDSVIVLGGTSSAKIFAVADFYYNKTERKLDSVITDLISSEKFSPDENFMSKFAPQFEEVKKYVSQPLGIFTETIDSRDALFGESKFVDLIHQIQLQLTGAQISFAAPLSMRAKIDSGEITVGDMFKLYHYENFLYVMKLTGKEIKNALEYSAALQFNRMKSPNDRLLNFVYDKNGNLVFSERTGTPMLKGRYYNFESAAGIIYETDVTKPAGERVKIISMQNGEPFDENKYYLVAVNSYRGNGGGGHLTKGAKIPKEKLNERVVSSTKRDLRYLMMNWIKNKKKIEPPFFGNWEVVPESFVERAKRKDFNLLFGESLN